MIDIKTVALRLKQADNIMILTHRKPDGDTIGSAFALYHALKIIGKNCVVSNSDIISHKLLMLTDGKTVLPEMENYEYIVSVDVAERKLFGEVLDKYKDKVDLCIDHHKTNENYAKESYVDSEAAATGEIIYKLIKELGVEINKEIAVALYTAICTDTGCFKFRNTTSQSMRIAAELMEKDIDASEINVLFFQTVSPQRIVLLKEVYEHMDIFESGKLAVSYLDKHDDFSEDDYDGLAGVLGDIEGVKAAALFREVEDGKFKVSVRGKKGFDCSALCRKFNGGGHEGAAGTDMYGTLKECIEEMKVSMIEEYHK